MSSSTTKLLNESGKLFLYEILTWLSTLVSLAFAEQLLVSRDFYYFGFLLMKNTRDDVFHISFDNVLLKDSVQISRYFINFTLSHATQQTIASLEHLALSYFAFVF